LGNVITPSVVTVLGSYDLAASDKVMPAYARPGEVVTCTIRLRNTGAVSASAALTDAIPAGTQLIPGSLWWSSGQAGADSGVVAWEGDVIARGVVIVRFQLQIGTQIEPETHVVNVASIEDQLGNLYQRSARTTVVGDGGRRVVFLPFVARAR
jgi:uncharacterized repeat protein (TIGR01451 family)